jgi:DNA primase large subunit
MGMDTLRAARYPFLKESAEFAEKHSADVSALIMSPSYADARKRGVNRVLESIRGSEVSYVPLMGFEYERLMEVMSYPYARILVSCLNDRFLTKRYALAESVRVNKLLGGERPSTVLSIAKELGVDAIDKGGELMMHFTDYLRLASRIKSQEWKLVNSELFNGH